MTQPAEFKRSAQFSAIETDEDLRDHLDRTLDRLEIYLRHSRSNLFALQRDDLSLRDHLVTQSTIHPDVVSLFAAQLNPRGAWVATTLYQKRDAVSFNGATYICVEGHTATTFADDLALNAWLLVGDNVHEVLKVSTQQAVGPVQAYTVTTGRTFARLEDLPLMAVTWNVLNILQPTLQVDGFPAKTIAIGALGASANALMTTDFVIYNPLRDQFIVIGRNAIYDDSALFRLGDYRTTSVPTTDPAWLLCDGKTVGNALSGADYPDNFYENLFSLLVTMPGNIVAGSPTPVWTNDDRVALPDLRLTTLVGVDPDSTTPVNTITGQNERVLTVDQMPAHTHTIRSSQSLTVPIRAIQTDTDPHTHDAGTDGIAAKGTGPNAGFVDVASRPGGVHAHTASSVGSGSGVSVLQRSFITYTYIKAI